MLPFMLWNQRRNSDSRVAEYVSDLGLFLVWIITSKNVGGVAFEYVSSWQKIELRLNGNSFILYVSASS